MSDAFAQISGTRFNSAFGVLAMMAIAWLLCPRKKRRAVNWRTIGIGLAVLFAFALLVLKTPVRKGFAKVGGVVDQLLAFSDAGAKFVGGNLHDDNGPWGFVFALKVGATIIFFATLMSLLYYARILPFIISGLGRFISKALGTSGAESFSTVADIFVGQTEAPLTIKPYISKLTDSELNACMIAGFATTAGGVLALYTMWLKDLVPDIAGHFVACSVMCAPASLVIAKLMLPEVEEPETAGRRDLEIPKSGSNLLDAISSGATDGGRLALNVVVMLVAFTALVAMINFGLKWVGEVASGPEYGGEPLTLQRILGWVFAPIAWLIGVPADETLKVGSLLGTKTALTELLAYDSMAQSLKADPSWLSERGRLIASYALCGFANVASIGIQIGGYSSLAPERRADLSRLAFRAMIGGLLTTCMVAAVAGLLA